MYLAISNVISNHWIILFEGYNIVFQGVSCQKDYAFCISFSFQAWFYQHFTSFIIQKMYFEDLQNVNLVERCVCINAFSLAL